MKIERYATRHNPTGHYLPERKGYGQTWVEPTKPMAKHDHFPRLHATRKDAHIVLSYWLKGQHSLWNYDNFGNVHKKIKTMKRKREDMEVVSIYVEIPE